MQLIKHYNPSVTGGSKGHNAIGPLELCLGRFILLIQRRGVILKLRKGPLCIPEPIGWHPEVDQLNAARSGAAASNLPHEVNDYLLPQVSQWNIPRNKFKYINLQIGSNELCYSCAQGSVGLGSASAENFEDRITETLDAIRAAIRE